MGGNPKLEPEVADTYTSPFFNGNTYPQIYDTLRRYIFANLKIDFQTAISGRSGTAGSIPRVGALA